MKRVCAYIGFSVAVTLLLLNLISTDYLILVTAGLTILFFVGLALPKLRKTAVVPLCMGSAVFACVLILCVNYATVQPQLNMDGQTAETEFYIVDIEETDSNGKYVYTAKTKSVALNNASQNIKLRIKCDKPINADYYQIIKANLKFRSISDNAYASYGYWGDNIFLTASCENPKVEDSFVNSVWKPVLYLRCDIINSILNVLDGDEGGLATALLTGSKNYISDELYSAFKYSGATHLMAVSGFHLTVITGVVLYILNKLRINDKISASVAILLSLVTIGVAGFSKSVIRASIMLIILLMGKLIKRRSDALNSLGLSVFIICLNPYAVCDVSAQLSVVAVFSLLVLNPILTKSINSVDRYRNGSLLSYLSDKFGIAFYNSISVAISVFVFSLPIMYIDFGYVSIAGIVSNVLLVPIGSVAIVLSWMVYISSKINFAVGLSAYLCKIANSLLVSIVGFFSDFSGAVVDISADFGWAIIGVLIIVALCFIIGNKKLIKPASIISLCLVLAVVFASVFLNYNSAQVLLCQNGSAALCQNGKTVVYYRDNNTDFYQLKNFLYSNNGKIDLVLLPECSSINDDSKFYQIIDEFKCDTVVTNEFNLYLFEYQGYDNIDICDSYSVKFDENLYVACSFDDYYMFNVNDVVISANYDGADIVVSGQNVSDCNGKINLNNSEIVYTVYNNSTYRARRVDIWH